MGWQFVRQTVIPRQRGERERITIMMWWACTCGPVLWPTANCQCHLCLTALSKLHKMSGHLRNHHPPALSQPLTIAVLILQLPPLSNGIILYHCPRFPQDRAPAAQGGSWLHNILFLVSCLLVSHFPHLLPVRLKICFWGNLN